jgi:glutamate---cysteine ligase / carboxylate-amine ligase
LALTASSPFFDGKDTGFASYRAQIWMRWPTSGMPSTFESWQHYRDVVSTMVASGLIADDKMIYTWLRPSLHVPTLEFRIGDAASTVEEAVMVAGLSRALAMAETSALRAGRQPIEQRPELLDLGVWQASRHGLDDGLADPLADPITGTVRESEIVVAHLLDHVEPHLGDSVERGLVLDAVERVLRHGNSAERQRAALQRSGDLVDVTHMLAREFLGTSAAH